MFLIPLFILMFASSVMWVNADLSTPEELKQSGAKTVAAVQDPVRRAEVDKVVKEILAESKQANKRFQAARKQIKVQYQDHAAGADEALLVLSDLNADWQVVQQRMINLQFKLREQMTEEEWNQIYGQGD